MKEAKIEGIITAMITPFTPKGDVDFEALRGVVNFQLENGVHGLYPCGSAGEGPLMSVEQRKRVAEKVLEEAAGRVPVIVHVGTTNTEETVELAKHAEEKGAVAVGAVTPYYHKPDLEGLLEHYRLLAEAVSIPVFVYNMPRLTGFNVTPEMVTRLCRLQNIGGVKDSSGDLIQIRTIIENAPRALIVINGADNLVFPALMMGVNAQISGTANVTPELFVELYKAYREGDYERALSHQTKINAVKKALEGPPIAPLKAALEMRGVDAGLPKLPLRPLQPHEKAKLRERLAALKLFW